MTDREKLIEILSVPIYPKEGADLTEVVADFLLDNDVRPISRAHWEECKTTVTVPGVKIYRCSACGRTVKERVGINVYEVYPYCHCGTKMNEEEKSR